MRINPMSKALLFVFLCAQFISCQTHKDVETIIVSEDLKLLKITDNAYIHISNITLQNGALFPCNGFVYKNEGQAYVFDTPANDTATKELIQWLQDDQKLSIKGVVFNHHHNDCIEGMDVFKQYNIPSIASKKTTFFMQQENSGSVDRIFENSLELTLGNKTIINRFFGEAHTADNIISYFPEEKIIFGGCMIKSLEARKGNLADANVIAWPFTVQNIKKAYPEVAIVIPGHGAHGDSTLLDYTISLFQTNENQ